MPESLIKAEIGSQPDCWRYAEHLTRTRPDGLPSPGERVAVIGCGTSWFMAQCYASLRESGGGGITDAFPASEFPLARPYDRVLAISRSGTTTEVLHALDRIGPDVESTVLTSTPDAIGERAKHIVDLSFCDERSVVQTRFATTVLAFLRAHLGEELASMIERAEDLLDEALDRDVLTTEQVSFLGTGWSVGIAHEAALKVREAANLWTESYPALEYRHGPISIAERGRTTWVFGDTPPRLADEVRATGAALVDHADDPMVDLLRVQRLAAALAELRGLDPDRPRHLTRSVVLQNA